MIFKSSNARKQLDLIYDIRVKTIFVDELFHFVWGHLIPSIYLFIQLGSSKYSYIFRLENENYLDLTKAMFHLFGVEDIHISTDTKDRSNNPIIVPRWDVFLLGDQLKTTNASRDPLIRRLMHEITEATDLKTNLRLRGNAVYLKTCIKKLRGRSAILKNILAPNSGRVNWYKICGIDNAGTLESIIKRNIPTKEEDRIMSKYFLRLGQFEICLFQHRELFKDQIKNESTNYQGVLGNEALVRVFSFLVPRGGFAVLSNESMDKSLLPYESVASLLGHNSVRVKLSELHNGELWQP